MFNKFTFPWKHGKSGSFWWGRVWFLPRHDPRTVLFFQEIHLKSKIWCERWTIDEVYTCWPVYQKVTRRLSAGDLFCGIESGLIRTMPVLLVAKHPSSSILVSEWMLLEGHNRHPLLPVPERWEAHLLVRHQWWSWPSREWVRMEDGTGYGDELQACCILRRRQMGMSESPDPHPCTCSERLWEYENFDIMSWFVHAWMFHLFFHRSYLSELTD